MSEHHEPGDDWTCSCGYDFFGGSGAYSWQLFEAHLPPTPRVQAIEAAEDRAEQSAFDSWRERGQ